MDIYISPPLGSSGASAADPSTSGSITGAPKSIPAAESKGIPVSGSTAPWHGVS